MAKTPEAALQFMDAIVPAATAQAAREAADIQAVIDAQKGGFQVQAYDWNFYSEQVRKARYDIDDAQVKPYFELDNVLENGVFYAANAALRNHFQGAARHSGLSARCARLRGLRRRRQAPRAFLLRLFQARQQEWRRLDVEICRPVAAAGNAPRRLQRCQPAEAGGGRARADQLHRCDHHVPRVWTCAARHVLGRGVSDACRERRRRAISSNFPRSSTSIGRAIPAIFAHYAKHYKTGAPMPEELAAKIRKAETFNKGYDMTELLAAAELDMQWHFLPASAPLQNPDEFEKQALDKTHLNVSYVPPRYRSSYFSPHLGRADTAPAITPISGRRCSPTTAISGSSKTAD